MSDESAGMSACDTSPNFNYFLDVGVHALSSFMDGLSIESLRWSVLGGVVIAVVCRDCASVLGEIHSSATCFMDVSSVVE